MKQSLLIAALAMTLTPAGFAMADTAEDEKKYMDKVEYHIEKADTNGDDMLSKAEVMAFAGEKFEKADLNGDNQLSAEELKTLKMKEYKDMKKKHKREYKKDGDKADPDVVDE